MIRVKNTAVLESMLIHPAHPKLIELLKWVSVRYSDVVFTEGFEERAYPSVHSTIPFRGMDIRSYIYQDPAAVVEDINANWVYDPSRKHLKCSLFHNTGRGAHIHLQVHENTIWRKEGTP